MHLDSKIVLYVSSQRLQILGVKLLNNELPKGFVEFIRRLQMNTAFQLDRAIGYRIEQELESLRGERVVVGVFEEYRNEVPAPVEVSTSGHFFHVKRQQN